jgi:hypothetical protein
MTDGFAATSAQTLPVLALAAVIELAALRRRAPQTYPPRDVTPGDPDSPHVVWGAYIVAMALWISVMIWIVDAEIVCLNFLRGIPVSPGSDGTVQGAMIAALILLVIFPPMSIAADIALNIQRRFRRKSSGDHDG